MTGEPQRALTNVPEIVPTAVECRRVTSRARGRRLTTGAPILVPLALCLWPSAAHAHEVGLSRGDYTADGPGVRADIIFARKELAGLVAGLDADHDGALTKAEVDAARDSIQGAVVGRIKVLGDGAPCAGTLERAELTEQDGILVRALYRCASRPKEASVTLTLLEDVPFGHRHLARVNAAGGTVDQVLSQRAPGFSFTLPPEAAPAAGVGGDADSPFLRGAVRAAAAWTLPAFLLGLLARSPRPRGAALAGGAFATALAAGIVVAALGVFAPSPRAAAVAAALSVAYVGADDLAAPGEARAPWIALPFGLVHGFACVVAFQTAPGALAPFASGAVAVAAVMTAVLAALLGLLGRARPELRARGVTALGAAALVAGLAGLVRGLY